MVLTVAEALNEAQRDVADTKALVRSVEAGGATGIGLADAVLQAVKPAMLAHKARHRHRPRSSGSPCPHLLTLMHRAEGCPRGRRPQDCRRADRLRRRRKRLCSLLRPLQPLLLEVCPLLALLFFLSINGLTCCLSCSAPFPPQQVLQSHRPPANLSTRRMRSHIRH